MHKWIHAALPLLTFASISWAADLPPAVPQAYPQAPVAVAVPAVPQFVGYVEWVDCNPVIGPARIGATTAPNGGRYYEMSLPKTDCLQIDDALYDARGARFCQRGKVHIDAAVEPRDDETRIVQVLNITPIGWSDCR